MATGSNLQDSRAPKHTRFTFQVPFKTFEEKPLFAVLRLCASYWTPLERHHWTTMDWCPPCWMWWSATCKAFPRVIPASNHGVFCAAMVRNKLLILLAHPSSISIGVYVDDECPEDQAMFVTEKCCFTDLVNGLSSPCLCGLTMKPWQFESVTQVNTDNMHAHVGMHVFTINVNFRKDTCFKLFLPAAVVIGKGLGQVRGFSVDIT